MLHVVTSNPISVKSIHRPVDNFIVAHVFPKLIIPRVATSMGHGITIYHQDGMSMDEYEDYVNDSDIVYEFVPVNSITDALDRIADVVSEEENRREEADRNRSEDDDVQDESMLAFVCDASWNRSATRYVNERLTDAGVELQAIDLYSTLRIPSREKLADYIKVSLGSSFVYPEDPVAFGYAVHRVLGGIMH